MQRVLSGDYDHARRARILIDEVYGNQAEILDLLESRIRDPKPEGPGAPMG
jgi:hypothetical protein